MCQDAFLLLSFIFFACRQRRVPRDDVGCEIRAWSFALALCNCQFVFFVDSHLLFCACTLSFSFFKSCVTHAALQSWCCDYLFCKWLLQWLFCKWRFASLILHCLLELFRCICCIAAAFQLLRMHSRAAQQLLKSIQKVCEALFACLSTA